MLSASAILRVVATLVVAAVLAALWQSLPPWSGAATTPQAPVVRPQPATAPPPPVARPPIQANPAPLTPASSPVAAPPPPVRATEAFPPPSPPPPPPVPPAAPRTVVTTPAPAPVPPPPATPAIREGTPAAADTRPVVVDLLNLNTATVQQLNALRGGGLIGRAVVRGRPYGSVEELLTKRVLSRSAYERIRDQVTVR